MYHHNILRDFFSSSFDITFLLKLYLYTYVFNIEKYMLHFSLPTQLDIFTWHAQSYMFENNIEKLK